MILLCTHKIIKYGFYSFVKIEVKLKKKNCKKSSFYRVAEHKLLLPF